MNDDHRSPWREQLVHLRAAVDAGAIPEERINDAVTRILRVKCAMGLLDHLTVDGKIPRSRRRGLSAQASARFV